MHAPSDGNTQPGCRLEIGTPIHIWPPELGCSETTIRASKGAEFRVNTLENIPAGSEYFIALIVTKKPDESQALVLVANDNGTHRLPRDNGSHAVDQPG